MIADYINALVSELFVHQSGSPHGGNLRSVMRKNLFNPGSGGGGTSGTGRRRLRRRRAHRWMDITQPDGGDAEQASPVVIASRSVSIAQQPLIFHIVRLPLLKDACWQTSLRSAHCQAAAGGVPGELDRDGLQ